jgi:tRNA pseudouridine55 synthase
VVRVDKPEGPTSHDVVSRARRTFGTRRIGHTGTLDPFASGLLLLCLGRATRLAEFLTGLDKSYEAVAVLGVATDTEDRDGQVISTSQDWHGLSRGQVMEGMSSLRGSLLQIPPRYSAKKLAGERAHRRARRGESVELGPRRVVVRTLELIDFSPPLVRFTVTCSSGTYVRALARDLGESLAVGAHLSYLRRTAIGPHSVTGALSPDEFQDGDRVRQAWIEPLAAMAHLPRVQLVPAQAENVRVGRAVQIEAEDGPVVVAAEGEDLLAVGSVGGGVFRPRKVLGA